MACAQMSSLSSTEGRLLEGEKGLAYWCMSTIQYYISFSFFFSLRSVTWILSHSFLSSLMLARVVLW